MKVLVCGSRDWSDWDTVWRILDEIQPSLVIEGCARGADRLAETWAKERGVPIAHYPADWMRLGKSAGPRRNEYMLAYSRPDLVVAFSLGTRGTADMIRRAKIANVPVRVVEAAK